MGQRMLRETTPSLESLRSNPQIFTIVCRSAC
jgi:hypothetical protein